MEKKYLLKDNHDTNQSTTIVPCDWSKYFLCDGGPWCGRRRVARASLVQSSPIMDVDIFEEEVEDFIGEGGGNLKRTLHFWEKKILTKKHLKTKKVSKEERLNIPCSLTLHRTGAERHF